MPLKQVIIAQVHVNGSNVNTSCDTSLTADTNKRELDLALIFSMQLAQIQVRPAHSRDDCVKISPSKIWATQAYEPNNQSKTGTEIV